ncbi:hypothetical protein K469DRAFT_609889 [Zopfia rhizophila CBS 207.26]|uniref:Mitochondrial export protein Som1 n=1 Tax=Zopfia rhizophila CBS 207.26 TaxID=1314779 RepID=A0A6A6DCJ6_9PEZI|nr:hypothetical protein K469DRAFT_609889 [Zopfia rhizophila CBS 207.26]
MAPPLEQFHASQLPVRINTLLNGKPRRPPIKLEECPLMEMVQYKCNIKKSDLPERPVILCEPVVRLFRKCEGGPTVETTAWEGLREQGGK